MTEEVAAMLDIAITSALIISALAYLFWRFRGIFAPRPDAGSCSGCHGACDEDSPASGGMVV